MKTLTVICLIFTASCASLKQQEEAWEKRIRLEADCEKVTDIELSEFTSNLGTSLQYANAKCDGKPVRCKLRLQTKASNVFLSNVDVSCKPRS